MSEVLYEVYKEHDLGGIREVWKSWKNKMQEREMEQSIVEIKVGLLARQFHAMRFHIDVVMYLVRVQWSCIVYNRSGKMACSSIERAIFNHHYGSKLAVVLRAAICGLKKTAEASCGVL